MSWLDICIDKQIWLSGCVCYSWNTQLWGITWIIFLIFWHKHDKITAVTKPRLCFLSAYLSRLFSAFQAPTYAPSLFSQALASEQVDAVAQKSSPDQASTRGSCPRPEGSTFHQRSASSIRRQQVGQNRLLVIMSKPTRGWAANIPSLIHYCFVQIRSKPQRRDIKETVFLESYDLSDPAPANLCPELPNTHTQMPLLLWPSRRVLLVSRMPWAQALANLPLQQYIMNKKEAFDLLSIQLISLAGHVSRWPHSL